MRTSRSLVQSIAFDTYPSGPACADFGIKSQEHYEAIYYPVRNGEITEEQLDKVLGDGPALTALVASAESNPHKNLVFKTIYDF